MKTKSGPCCGEHAQPIPTKGHPHVMHFILLLAGMGLIYSLAGIILLTNIYKNHSTVVTPTTVSRDASDSTIPVTVEIPAPAVVSVEVI